MVAETITATPADEPLDMVLLMAWLGALLAGMVMVASASMDQGSALYGNPFHFVVRHAAYVAAALGAAGVVLCVPVRTMQAAAPVLLLVTLALLVAVLLPGIGREVNGARRWVGFAGVSLQASEVARFGLITWFAAVIARDPAHGGGLLRWIAVLLILGASLALLLAEPDFGTAVVVAATCGVMAFLGGLKLRWLVIIGGAGVAGFVTLAVTQPYRMQRLLSFRDPFADQFGAGYQLVQALIAFGRGEWFGLGIGRSIQKAFFLPEAHNDFLVAVVAEELGIFGVAAIAMLLGLVVWRLLGVGMRASARGEAFGAQLAWGAAVLLAVQTIVSIGVNSGALPTKGITLPFFSYGGNSLIVCSALVALALRVDWEARFGPAIRPTRRRPAHGSRADAQSARARA